MHSKQAGYSLFKNQNMAFINLQKFPSIYESKVDAK